MVSFYDAETYQGLTRPTSPNSKYPAGWQTFVKDTKVLYYKSHYKRCANQCEQMLQDQRGMLYPLHETFLHFYIAICNESLGLAAHKFSSKKLPFLNAAKDAFTAAVLSLPSPCASAECDDDDPSGGFPQSSDLDYLEDHDHESNAVQPPELDSSSLNPSISDTKHSLHERCDSGYDSEPEPLPTCTDTTPDFNSYSARHPLAVALSPNNSAPPKPLHEERFNGLDLENEDLIPKPLFIKKRTTAATTDSSATRPLPPTISLPPTSHNMRKTAMSHQILSHTAPLFSPSTAPPLTPSSFKTSLPSSANLQTFHTLLHTHLTTITRTITHTTALQRSHKLAQTNRIPSFWSFQPVAASHATSEGEEEVVDAAKREKRERIERLRQGGWRVCKEMHGWKGGKHYEELEGRALGELGELGGGWKG